MSSEELFQVKQGKIFINQLPTMMYAIWARLGRRGRQLTPGTERAQRLRAGTEGTQHSAAVD